MLAKEILIVNNQSDIVKIVMKSIDSTYSLIHFLI